MAIISKLVCDQRDSKPHRTVVEGFVQVVGAEEPRSCLVQIATMGSLERESPPKVSQTMQFTEKSARELIKLFHQVYGDSVLRDA